MKTCIDCGKSKRSSKGDRCASCSVAWVATIKRKKLGLPPKKDIITFSVKVFDPNTEKWEIHIGVSNLNGGQAGRKREYWESADAIKEFFYLEHGKYLARYKFALFQNNELIELLS